jgi:hypothetical protein
MKTTKIPLNEIRTLDQLEMEKYRLQFDVLYSSERIKDNFIDIKDFLKPRNLAFLALDKVTGGWSHRMKETMESHSEEGSVVDRVAQSDLVKYGPVSIALGYKLFRFIQHRRQKKQAQHNTQSEDY